MFDGDLNLPLQQLQLHNHDNVKASYNSKMRSAFLEEYLLINKVTGLSILDYLTFCLAIVFLTDIFYGFTLPGNLRS